MTESYKEELDRIEKRDRKKTILAVIAFFVISLSTISIGLFQYSGQISNVSGTVTGLTGGYSKSGKTYLVVLLENGNKVEALLPTHGSVQKDKKVILAETKNIFGYKRYFFKEYVKEKEGTPRKIAF